MNIATDLSWSTISKSLIRLPSKKYKTRPSALNTQDNTRTKEAKEAKENE